MAELLARHPGDCIERVALACVREHVVEERPELRARDRDARVRNGLHELLEIELRRDEGRRAVEGLEEALLLLKGVRHRLVLGNVGVGAEPASDPALRVL
jgi:hypothetical protein